MMTPGTKLGGRYRLDERIATGGMGDVWHATDEVLGRGVAVKVLLPSLLNEPGFIERFRGEARVVATLSHPNIVRVYDYGESPMQGGGQVAYLVMEFISGEALTAQLQRQGRLTAAETLPIIAQAAEALHAAHSHGIIHRDVKPGNLMITPNGTVMLTDFGIARSALTGGLTQAGSVLGTAAYISPEQASGMPVTGQSDVYSLGIVAYQCLAGRRPFDSDNPVELAMRHVNTEPPPLPDDVPAAARAFVAAALAKDVSQRFATGEDMAAAARAAAGGTIPHPVTPQSGGAMPAAGPMTPAAGVGVTPPMTDGGPARGAAVPPPGLGLDSRTTVQPAVDPHTPAPAQRRNKMLLVIAGSVLALVLVAGGLWAVLGGKSDDDTGGEVAGGDDSSSSAEENKDEFDIKVEDYLNRPPDEVKAELEEEGFKVSIQGNGRFTKNITPNGSVERETEVVIETSISRVKEEDGSQTDPGQSGQPTQPNDHGSGNQSCEPGTIGCKAG